jgi:deoxyribonuclease V
LALVLIGLQEANNYSQLKIMILAIDVDYKPNKIALIGGVLFKSWQDSTSHQIIKTQLENIADYKSGEFYKRELPPILKLLQEIPELPEIIVIDGYVFLDNSQNQKGLGWHLFEALGSQVPIIGVAKNRFKDISDDFTIQRGNSKKPLFVTSIGIKQNIAKSLIQNMHGDFRIPTLLKKVDQVCRKI